MGYYVIFEVNRHLIRREMESASKETLAITVIEVPVQDSSNRIRWINNKEFVFNGNLYDVIYTSSRITTTRYYCVHDKKEEKLIRDFQHANTNKLTQALWNLMVHTAIPVPVLTLGTNASFSYSYPEISVQTCSVPMPPDNPPPRLHT